MGTRTAAMISILISAEHLLRYITMICRLSESYGHCILILGICAATIAMATSGPVRSRIAFYDFSPDEEGTMDPVIGHR